MNSKPGPWFCRDIRGSVGNTGGQSDFRSTGFVATRRGRHKFGKRDDLTKGRGGGRESLDEESELLETKRPEGRAGVYSTSGERKTVET